MAGFDQFGGNSEAAPIIAAYQMGVKERGEAFMRRRFKQSVVRLLHNIFRTGLFENPYLDAVNSKKLVGNSEFMNEGYRAQLQSVVMLKNKNGTLPLTQAKSVYVPKRYTQAGKNYLGFNTPETIMDIVSGKAEPSALLPLQMPADMLIVEKQFKDLPQDMNCYVDSEGHKYDFGYGLNWKDL